MQFRVLPRFLDVLRDQVDNVSSNVVFDLRGTDVVPECESFLIQPVAEQVPKG